MKNSTKTDFSQVQKKFSKVPYLYSLSNKTNTIRLGSRVLVGTRKSGQIDRFWQLPLPIAVCQIGFVSTMGFDIYYNNTVFFFLVPFLHELATD